MNGCSESSAWASGRSQLWPDRCGSSLGAARGKVLVLEAVVKSTTSPQRQHRVNSQHAADCGSLVAVCCWGTVANSNRGRTRRTAATPALLLPCARRSCLRYGLSGEHIHRRRAYAASSSLPLWARSSRHHHGYHLRRFCLPLQLQFYRRQH
jgi:hypothetical protein